jgi:hypothetical protein
LELERETSAKKLRNTKEIRIQSGTGCSGTASRGGGQKKDYVAHKQASIQTAEKGKELGQSWPKRLLVVIIWPEVS